MEDQFYIFRSSITLKDGRILKAKDCGIKAFRILVKDRVREELKKTLVKNLAKKIS